MFDDEGLEIDSEYLYLKPGKVRQLAGEIKNDEGHVFSLDTLTVDGKPFD